MVVDNSPEARLKKLQEKNMGTGTTASNLTKQVVSSTPTSVNNGLTPISTPTPLATPATTPTTGIPAVTPTQGVIPKNELQSFSDATKGQDVEFRQTYREGLAPKTETTPTETSKGAVGLDGAMLGAYNQLTDQEKKTYDSLALSGLKSQTDYLQKVKEQKEFMGSQEDIRVKMSENTMKMEEIASQERLAKAQKSLADLKQNVGYLGMGGTPGKSQAKLDAVTRQVADSENTYKNIVEVERLMGENRQLGQQSNAEQYSRQLEILQDDLDSKVNKVLQGALNEFSAKEMEGKLDTIEEIEAFQQQIYSQMDNDISSLTDINLEARKFLIERYDALASEQKAQMQATEKAKVEFEKNANTLNKDMSNALGYFVNNNGEALVDETTGMRIVVPPETTTNYDPSTGQMILMTKNRDGSIGVQLKQVGTAQNKAPQTTTIENPDGTKTTMQWTGSQWAPIQGGQASGTIGGMLNIPRTGNNVGQDTNNPGNIMGDTEGQRAIATRLGAIGFYQSPNGRTYAVFPDMQTGVNASIADLQTKLSGGSSWATPNTTLAKFASGWVSGPNAPINQNAVNNYVTLTGASANTPIKDIPLETLAKAIFKNEGVDISKSADLSGVGTQGDQKAEAMALVQGLGGTEGERATFAKNIMDRANKKGISLKEAKKDLGYKTLDDKNFEETRKQQYTDMRKGYSESTGNAKTALTLLNEPQTAIGDVASVVGFLKTIDPASVARESEVESVENARGVIDSLSNVFTKAKEGTKLTETQRTQLKGAIQTIVDAQDKKFLETVYDMKKEFDTRGLDATVYIPKTYIDKAQKEYGKAEEAKKKLGGFSLSDILNNLD